MIGVVPAWVVALIDVKTRSASRPACERTSRSANRIARWRASTITAIDYQCILSYQMCATATHGRPFRNGGIAHHRSPHHSGAALPSPSARIRTTLRTAAVSVFVRFAAFGDNCAMTPPQTYSRFDVERWLGKAEVRQGQRHVGAVRSLDVQPQSISALVQGSAPRPYRVDIRFASDLSGASHVSPNCSCPVGGYCMHAAAVLLAGIDSREPSQRVNPELLSWFEALRQLQCAVAKAAKPKRQMQTAVLFYVLDLSAYDCACEVSLLKAKPGPDGRPGSAAIEWKGVERALVQPPQFVSEEDIAVLRLLWAQRARDYRSDVLPLIGCHGDEVLRRMLRTGRVLFDSEERVPLKLGEPRCASIDWQPDELGRLRPQLHATPAAAVVFALEPMWYVDPSAQLAGPLELPFGHELARRLLNIPPITQREAPLVAAALRNLAPELPLPVDDVKTGLPVIDAPATPVLHLGTLDVQGMGYWRGYTYSYGLCQFDYAVPGLRYGDVGLAVGDTREFIPRDNGELVRVMRKPEAEAQFLKLLSTFGLQKVPSHLLYGGGITVPTPIYGLNAETDWPG